MVTAFSLWPMNFGINGFTEFIIQKPQISKEEVNSIFWLNLFLATLLAFGFTFFGFLLVDFYSEPALSGIAAAMAAGIIFQAFSMSHLALLKRDMKFTSIAIAELVAVILSIIFAIAVAVWGWAYWAVVTRQLTIPIVMMIAAWILCPWRPSRPQQLSEALPGLKYAVRVYCNVSVGYLMRSVDRVLIGKFHGSESLGNYDRAYHLFAVPLNQLLFPLNSVALATLSRLRHDKERLSAYYTKAISIIAFPGTLAALVLTLSAQDLVLLLLGPKWTEAGRIVMAFGPGIAAGFVYATHPWLHLSLGTPNRWLRWSLFSSALTVMAFILAAPSGPVAMAIAYSGITYVLVVPGLWYAGRPIQLSLGVVISSVWAYFASAISVGIFWLYLSEYWLPLNNVLTRLSPLNRIVIVVSSMSCLYIALVMILQRGLRSIREILSLLPQILPRREPQSYDDE
jgi:PST family polysaccharide transporter